MDWLKYLSKPEMNIVQGVVMCLTQCYHVCSLTLTLAGISRCPFDYKSIGTIHSRPLSLPLSLLSYIPLSPTSLILMSLISKSVRRDLFVDDDDDEAARADADARPEPTPMRCDAGKCCFRLSCKIVSLVVGVVSIQRRRPFFWTSVSNILLNAHCPVSFNW